MSIIELKVPEIGESISEVTLSQWLKENGSYVSLDEPICEFESDKATLEFPAEVAGIITWVASEGDDLEIGALVATIDTSAAAPEKGEVQEQKTVIEAEKEEVKPPEKDTYAKGEPSPAASKILKEKGIAASTVKGTGKDGRIIKEDALKAKAETEKEIRIEEKTVSSPIVNNSSFIRKTSTQKMSRMRRTIASRLVNAKNNTAMLTTFNEVDLTEVMALRKKYQEQFVEKNGIKLGFMSLFAKACAKVLMEMPDVNAQLKENEILYHDYADISIAISTPTGLVVPPVKNVESLTFAEVEYKIKELAGKARAGKLTLEEMQGGTFTITNGGIFGSMMSTPILNAPQSAILGMHTIQQRPVAVNGEVMIRPMMYLALSYDHRVIDGSTSVTFLVKVKKLLEDPITLLLDI